MEYQKPNLSSKQILKIIRKKSYTQIINGVDYTYSLLKKSNEKFIFQNERLLVLKGIEKIFYVRKFNQETNLPFASQTNLPQAKASFSIRQIQYVTSNREKLIICFNCQKKGKVKWEFRLRSKGGAVQWRRKIQIAQSNFKEFNESKYQKFEQFKENKIIRQVQIKSQQVKVKKKFRKSIHPIIQGPLVFSNEGLVFPEQKYLKKSKTQDGSISDVKMIRNSGPSQYELNAKWIQNENSNITLSNRPIAILFKGSQVAKTQDVLQNSNIENNQIIQNKIKNQSQIPLQTCKRSWIRGLVDNQQQSQLIINFSQYIKQTVIIIIDEMSKAPQIKTIHPSHADKEYVRYELHDCQIEFYYFLEEHLISRHKRYEKAVAQFKNMSYLMSITKNKGCLRVPLVVLFEYKGFVGVGKTKINKSTLKLRNIQFNNSQSLIQIEQQSRISSTTLLDKKTSKIVHYGEKSDKNIFFVQNLINYLPIDPFYQQHLLRPQLLQDEQFEDIIYKNKNSLKSNQIQYLINLRAEEITKQLQFGFKYFTNTGELIQILNQFGLDIHHLGIIYNKCNQSWLKQILKTQMICQIIKKIYIVEIQAYIVSQQRLTTNKDLSKLNQRVISFLNVVLGNNQTTNRLWKNIKQYGESYFKISNWNGYFDSINIQYLMQSIQSNLNILLSSSAIEKVPFQSSNTLQFNDFKSFNFFLKIYDLSFTNKFDQIQSCLQQISEISFHHLCQIVTQQNQFGITYFEILQNHSIYNKINSFFLNFVSPQQNKQLYDKIQLFQFPSKLLFETKLTEIKWYLQTEKYDLVNKPANFILNNAEKWFGQIHTIYTFLYRLLAESYSEIKYFYTKALKYATLSLDMQENLLGKSNEYIWKDYFLIGKIYYFNKNYIKAIEQLNRSKSKIFIMHSQEQQNYGQLCLLIIKCHINLSQFQQALSVSKEIYLQLKQERQEQILQIIVEIVEKISFVTQKIGAKKQFFHFIETDFSLMLFAFIQNQSLLNRSIYLCTIPKLKQLLANEKISQKISFIIHNLMQLRLPKSSIITYLNKIIIEREFPFNFYQYQQNIEGLSSQIISNQIVQRWKSYSQMSKSTLFQKIRNTKIHESFQFIAYLTVLINILGVDCFKQILI